MDNRKTRDQTRDWRVSRKHKPQTSKNASLCEQALWEKNSKEREGNGGGGGAGEQAFSLFPLPSTPLDQRPVHRLQKRIPRNLLLACRLCLFVAFLNYL